LFEIDAAGPVLATGGPEWIRLRRAVSVSVAGSVSMSFRRRFLRESARAGGFKWSRRRQRARVRRKHEAVHEAREAEEKALIAKASAVARETIKSREKNWLGRLGDAIKRGLPAARRSG
jgi:hypothetical protein